MPKAKKKRVLVPRTRGNGNLTEAGYWGFIRSALRAKFLRWWPRYAVLADAKRAVEPSDGLDKRTKFVYVCCKCDGRFPQKLIEVDHKIPCGSLKCAEDVGPFAVRLFCEKDGLQVVCKECHRAITNAQRKAKDEDS